MITLRSLAARMLLSVTALSLVWTPLQAQAYVANPFPAGFLKPTPAPRQRYSEIPIESNPRVRKWIYFFTHEDRARFDRFMIRGARYRILVQDILAQNGVPPALYYLGMIESGYASRAHSHAKAVGIWQFMAPTARQYGLRVDREVDERLDVMRSTKAAARYLKGLEEEFGSWYLAMAAYNSGEGRVRSAVRRQHTRDFWTLARRGALPAETIDYIPKFQAAMAIARNPYQYGFGVKTHYEFPDLKRVRFSDRLTLTEVARRQRVSAASVRALNPHLLRDLVPHSRRGYEVWIPKQTSRKI